MLSIFGVKLVAAASTVLSVAIMIITALIIIFGLGCALAAGTEIVQKQLSYRTGDLKDFEADALALIVGSVFILLINFIIAINKSSKQK